MRWRCWSDGSDRSGESTNWHSKLAANRRALGPREPEKEAESNPSGSSFCGCQLFRFLTGLALSLFYFRPSSFSSLLPFFWWEQLYRLETVTGGSCGFAQPIERGENISWFQVELSESKHSHPATLPVEKEQSGLVLPCNTGDFPIASILFSMSAKDA